MVRPSVSNIHDAFHVGRGAKNYPSSIATCLQFVGHSMPRDSDVVPVMEVAAISKVLREHLQGTHSHALHCPRAAPSVGVVSCTYYHWFRPFSKHRRYCQLPVSGTRMQRFLQFKLGSHNCLLLLVGFLGTNMLQELTGYARTVVELLLLMNYT